MCDRYTITVLPSDLELWLNVKSPYTYKPRYNAAPSQFLPIIANNNPREIIMARWGFLPSKSSDTGISSKLYNKPLDIIKSSKLWKKSLHSKRCLILADAFYSWKSVGKDKKIPYRVFPKQKKLICFAGIWDELTDHNNNSQVFSFMMLTRSAYKPVNDISGSMPVIIEPGKEMYWLEGKNLSDQKLMDMMEIEDWALLDHHPVSPIVENIKIDKPDLIKPVPPSDQYGNYTLFD